MATVWSYSFKDHFGDKHASAAVPSSVQAAASLRYHELDYLKSWLGPFKSRRETLCNKKPCDCVACDEELKLGAGHLLPKGKGKAKKI